VNAKTIQEVSRAGADVFVAGSAIFGAPDYKAVIEDFKTQVMG
jgi:ribulose-phosphate 3-epimerase